MAVQYDLMVPNGTYTKDGQQKTHWVKIGCVMDKKAGGLVMRLDVIPVYQIDKDGNEIAFNGWVNMFAPNPREGQTAQRQAPVADFDDSDDIPF